MSYQVLARKWRPQLFQEVVGQQAIVKTLQNALKTQKIAHSYLFAGTRGVGKTTVARLFAKSLLCHNPKADGNPCLLCNSCKSMGDGSSMDFVEVDGASNNSVENIRSLIENVQYLPTKGDYKVYVIDEVHMLSISAFNALLKTLEEPPAHVVFIFATTEAEKIPQTILSRCQRFDFKNALVEDIEGHLKRISKVEKIEFESDEVVTILAQKGQGSFRDALSLLDQVLALADDNKITESTLIQSLGVARLSAIKNLVSSMLEGHLGKMTEVYEKIIQENVEVKNIAHQILDHLYLIIQHIDEPEIIYKKELVKSQCLDQISISELFWIYEGLNRDFEWALTSLSPVKVMEVVLKKYTLRKVVLKSKDTMIDSTLKKKELIKPKKKTWLDFVTYLKENAPGILANLERGDKLQEPYFTDTTFSLTIGFADESKVFYDFFQDKEVVFKLKEHIGSFFEVKANQIDLKFILLAEKEKNETNFQSIVEKEEEIINKEKEDLKESLLNHPNVTKLEKEFNAKADKVILNK